MGYETRVEKDKLIITVNLKNDMGLSKSGKSKMIASTGGNQRVPGTDVVMGLNVYRKA